MKSLTASWCGEESRRIHDHLFEGVLPFWRDQGPDWERGGLFTAFDNRSGLLRSHDKFIWSQGRALWLFVQLYRLTGDAAWKTRADHVYKFVLVSAFDGLERCYFQIAADGEPIPDSDGNLFPSTYVDCFVVLGLAAHGAHMSCKNSLSRAVALFRSIDQRLREGSFRTAPYPVPPGMDAHGVHMMVALCGAELYHALTSQPSGGTDSAFVHEVVADELTTVAKNFGTPSGPFREFRLRTHDSSMSKALILNYHNPGHTLETVGLLLQCRTIWGEVVPTKQLKAITLDTLLRAWDSVAGGLFTFVPAETGDPEALFSPSVHVADPLAGHTMTEKIQRDWSLKLWWVHAEAMYTVLALAIETEDPVLIQWYERIRSYTLETFPHPEGTEWIQIRDRWGVPIDAVVALPVKDPFHIPRSFLGLLGVLDRSTRSTPA